MEDYLDWYREFVRMGNSLKDGAVTEFHWMAAFRRGLMHKALFEREFVKLKDREKQEGREYDLAECNNFVMQELRNRLEVQQYKNLYGDRQEYSSRGRHEVGHLRGMGGTPTCSHCLKGGHTMETCWALHPHLKPSRPPTTPDYTPQSRGGRGAQASADPLRPYRPPRSFSAPPPQMRRDDHERGKGDGKGKGKGKGRGKGKGDGKGKGKGKGRGSDKRDLPKRIVGEVHVTTPSPH